MVLCVPLRRISSDRSGRWLTGVGVCGFRIRSAVLRREFGVYTLVYAPDTILTCSLTGYAIHVRICAMMTQLIPLEGGSPIAVDKPIIFFGRHPDCDVVLTHSRKVSRKHCCLAVIDEHFVIRDLGSMNGLRHNGEPVKKEAKLQIGDEFHVGDVGFRIQLATEMPRRSSSPPTVQVPPAPTGSSPPRPGSRSAGPPKMEPRYLSQDMPVAIPEEGAEFSVEETQAKRRSGPTAPLPKAPSPAPSPAPKAKPKPKSPTDSDSVIRLGDSDIIDL